MNKERRIARRKDRQSQKEPRRKAFKKIVAAIESASKIDLEKSMPYKEKFNEVWPLMKALIEILIILRITGEKFDTSAQKIVLVGENMYKKKSSDDLEVLEFLEKLTKIWEKVEFILEILKIAVNDKTDDIIDKAIEIGEWVFDYED
jgi:hypothetical protein